MSKRVLVVEDEEDNRRIVRDLLTSVGYEIIEAVTGEEGVTAAETHHPDLSLQENCPSRGSTSPCLPST